MLIDRSEATRHRALQPHRALSGHAPRTGRPHRRRAFRARGLSAVCAVVLITGAASPTLAAGGDANGDGAITINQIIQAVNNALNGCGGA